MGYTDEAGAQKMVARLYNAAGFTTTTIPTELQLLAFIEETSAEIDMALGSVGYVTPVTTPASAVTWLKAVCNYGVAAEALKAAFPESVQSSNGGPVIPAYAYWEKRYQDALALIREGSMSLPDAPTTGAQDAQTYLTDNPDNNPFEDGTSEGQQPIFSLYESLRPF